MQEYVAMWQNFFNFSDRTSRRGYWMASLINFLIVLVLTLLVNVSSIISYVSYLYSLLLFIPALAMNVRRLRDAGKKWPWIFINFVPLVGQIIFLVFLCQGTQSSEGVQV